MLQAAARLGQYRWTNQLNLQSKNHLESVGHMRHNNPDSEV